MEEGRTPQWVKGEKERGTEILEQSVGMFTQGPRIGVKRLAAKRKLDVKLYKE